MFSSRTQLFAASLLRDVKQRERKYGRKTLDFVRARAQIIVIFGALERQRQKVGFSQTKRGILKTCAHGCIRLNRRRRGARFAVSLSLLRGAGSQQKEKPSLLVVLAPRLFTFN
jgi:hypothetical protein